MMGDDLLDAPPVDLRMLSPGQLNRLRIAMYVFAVGEHECPSGEAMTEHQCPILTSLQIIREDPQVRAWMWQRCMEVDGEHQRQCEILEAAELGLAGGHITSVDFDDVEPELGWGAYCRCGWWRRCLPTEEAAKSACEAHEHGDRQ